MYKHMCEACGKNESIKDGGLIGPICGQPLCHWTASQAEAAERRRWNEYFEKYGEWPSQGDVR